MRAMEGPIPSPSPNRSPICQKKGKGRLMHAAIIQHVARMRPVHVLVVFDR